MGESSFAIIPSFLGVCTFEQLSKETISASSTALWCATEVVVVVVIVGTIIGGTKWSQVLLMSIITSIIPTSVVMALIMLIIIKQCVQGVVV